MKRLIAVSGDDLTEKRVMATFRLVGERVYIDAPSDVIRMFGLRRIYLHRLLEPNDGAAYYDALDAAFSRSTHCYIETLRDMP